MDTLRFAISNGLVPVEEFAFAEAQPAGARLYEFRFGGRQLRAVKVELFTDRGCGESTGLEMAY
jgi:hypothetical protein